MMKAETFAKSALDSSSNITETLFVDIQGVQIGWIKNGQITYEMPDGHFPDKMAHY